MTTTEYGVARVLRSGELQPAGIAAWTEIARAHEYMLWMNHDLARAMREEADEHPDSEFTAVYKDRFEGTHCVVVEREVSEWRVSEPVTGSLKRIDGAVPAAGFPWQPSDMRVASEW